VFVEQQIARIKHRLGGFVVLCEPFAANPLALDGDSPDLLL